MAPTDKPEPPKPRVAPRQRRPGLPDESSVVAETTFTSPKGTTYRVLKTNEKDAYDRDRSEKKRPG
jgi:hypothetical protein